MEETFHIIIYLNNPVNKEQKLLSNWGQMKPDKLQTVFIHWLNAALQDARWRTFTRARLRESELPVIDLANEGYTPASIVRRYERGGANHFEKVREKHVINLSD